MDAIKIGVSIVRDILAIIRPALGKKCCRVRVGAYKSLSLGFGGKKYHNNQKIDDDFYGEWEMGTYYCAWRVCKNNRILCGVSDPEETINDLNARVQKIDFGSLYSVTQLSEMDIRVETDSGVVVDFLATISDDDEYFHIFCPDNVYIELSKGGKWTIGKSNKPFHPEEDILSAQ